MSGKEGTPTPGAGEAQLHQGGYQELASGARPLFDRDGYPASGPGSRLKIPWRAIGDLVTDLYENSFFPLEQMPWPLGNRILRTYGTKIEPSASTIRLLIKAYAPEAQRPSAVATKDEMKTIGRGTYHFLQLLADCREISIEETREIVGFLTRPELIFPSIEAVVAELDRYVVDTDHVVHERVRNLRRGLYWCIQNRSRELIEKNVNVVLFGSTLYDDPEKGDLDVLFVTDHYDEYFETVQLPSWIQYLEKNLKDTGFCSSVHEFHLSLAKVEEYAEFIVAAKRNDLRMSDIEEILQSFKELSTLLNGALSPLLPNADTFQEKAIDICRRFPLVGLIALLPLKDTLARRKERKEQGV